MLTDRGNAQRLAQAHGADLRWVTSWGKWIRWDGRRWKPTDVVEVRQLATQTLVQCMREVTREMGDIADQLQRGVGNEEVLSNRTRYLAKVFGWLRKSFSARGLNAIPDLLRSEKGIAIRHDALDRDPWLLNVANGTLDLRTGCLRPHCREDLQTRICPTAYNPDAGCERWMTALLAIFDSNHELVAYLQRLAGYCLSGSVEEQILPIFWGSGSNGKSVLFETLRQVMGPDYAMTGAQDLLGANEDAHPTAQADLFGRRMVTLSETKENGRLNEPMIKRLTGSESIRARRMREDFWEFTPTHKILLATNHKPEVRGNDHGIWRRLRLVPFVVRFWDPDKGETGPATLMADKGLQQKLLEHEREGILAWMVAGARDWLSGGLREPKLVQVATSSYKDDQDIFGRFLSETTTTGPGLRCKASDLYRTYAKWHEDSGERGMPMSSRKFGESLTERGFEKFTSNGTWYRGLSLCGGSHGHEEGFPR